LLCIILKLQSNELHVRVGLSDENLKLAVFWVAFQFAV